jgi:hypothetical protein
MITQATPRLPLWRTVADAYLITIRNLGYLSRISWLWVLVMAPIAFSYHYFAFRLGWVGADEFSRGSLADLAISALLYMPMLASIAVGWHRRLLAGEEWQSKFYLQLDRVVAGYLGFALLVSLTAIRPLFAVVWLEDRATEIAAFGILSFFLGIIASLAVGLFISTKIWLVLPARALGRSQFNLRQAWKASNRNFWRLFAGFLLCTVPVLVIAGVDGLLEVDWTKVREPAVYAGRTTIYNLITTFLFGMPLVSFLSLAYRRLVMLHDQPPDASP